MWLERERESSIAENKWFILSIRALLILNNMHVFLRLDSSKYFFLGRGQKIERDSGDEHHSEHQHARPTYQVTILRGGASPMVDMSVPLHIINVVKINLLESLLNLR